MSAASIIIIIDDIEARLAAIKASALDNLDRSTQDAIEAELVTAQGSVISAQAMS